MAQHFRTEFMQIPVVTRVYTTTCVLTTIAVVSVILQRRGDMQIPPYKYHTIVLQQ